VLTWDDVLKEKSAWDTITWFAALVMMATFLNKLGLIALVFRHARKRHRPFGLGLGAHRALLLLGLYVCALYVCQHHRPHHRHARRLLRGRPFLGAPPMLFALMMAAASSIMMTLTHYATGTSPVIFGSGYTTLAEWWKAGFIMSVVNLIIFVVIVVGGRAPHVVEGVGLLVSRAPRQYTYHINIR
jgi:DASS family divalent anion:Na+ symporter